MYKYEQNANVVNVHYQVCMYSYDVYPKALSAPGDIICSYISNCVSIESTSPKLLHRDTPCSKSMVSEHFGIFCEVPIYLRKYFNVVLQSARF